MNCTHPSGHCPWACEGYVPTCPVPESQIIERTETRDDYSIIGSHDIVVAKTELASLEVDATPQTQTKGE